MRFYRVKSDKNAFLQKTRFILNTDDPALFSRCVLSFNCSSGSFNVGYGPRRQQEESDHNDLNWYSDSFNALHT